MDLSSFNINIKSLECFRMIINTGSATAAAKQLGLTQPGASRLLGLLESHAGFELFYREKGRLIPTQEALTLSKEVELALASIDRVSQLAKNLQNADFGELTIVAPPSFAESILSDVIADFITQYPKVFVSLESHGVETAKDMVALRAVDCGFIKLPDEHPGLVCEELISAGTLCALPENHRLTGKKVIKATDLRNEPLILLGKGRLFHTQIEQVFHEAGVDMNIRIETHTVGAACAFARRNAGIAMVNEILGLQFATKGIVLRKFAPRIRHEYAFMTSSYAPMTRITKKFFEHCKAYFANNRYMLT